MSDTSNEMNEYPDNVARRAEWLRDPKIQARSEMESYLRKPETKMCYVSKDVYDSPERTCGIVTDDDELIVTLMSLPNKPEEWRRVELLTLEVVKKLSADAQVRVEEFKDPQGHLFWIIVTDPQKIQSLDLEKLQQELDSYLSVELG